MFLYVYKYVDQERLGCHAGHHGVCKCNTRGESEESIAHRPCNPGQSSPEVQSRNIGDLTKRIDVLQNFLKKSVMQDLERRSKINK